MARNKPASDVPVHRGSIVPAELSTRVREIHRRLRRAQPSPKVELDHEDAWQLLVATILAARSNDRLINRITPELFARWPTPAALARAPQAAVEKVVQRSGFFRVKAKMIRQTAQAVEERFGGEVPATMEALCSLPGVARKTANVVLASVFRVGQGIIVDLHVIRLCKRLGITSDEDPVRIEALLCALFPRASWVDVGHRLVLHGRHVCTARKPRCARCPLAELCPSASEEPAGRWTERADWERVLTESRGQIDPTER
ncbi:endonuclease III [Paraliomyxa miuraensis]|uniref:endonuclease III n=1 Tax=Paraliomyxa miuraensis TaxID=376150 RepID=UPI00225B6810|nr:endonuclease III [Paraliomyxa miuraensis]MCX4242321.1 endonuclease III [Paraliomyxa miuraensis]